MVLSVPVIALGATLGTATSILALCGLTCLCKCKQTGKGTSDKDQDLDTENAQPRVLQTVQQFNLEKTTEPVQPRAILKFPHIYGPKPVVTSSEIVNYSDYNLKTTDVQAKGKPAVLDEKRRNIQVNEELFILPQNGGVKDVCVTELLSPEKDAGCNQVPEVRYALGYDQQKEMLSVAFLEVMYGTTAGEQNNGCDCYILGTLVSRSGIMEAQTVLKKRQPHMIWEEALLFPLKEEELPDAGLIVTLRNCDKFSRHSIVGEIKPSLAKIGEPNGTAQWEKVTTPEKEPDAGYGEVLLSISYLPAANRLLVVLIKAKNLHSKQLKELLGKDISVKVTLKHQALKLKKKQTKRAKHKINPVWNEMIMFEVPHDLLCASSVELEMLSQDVSRYIKDSSMEFNHWESKTYRTIRRGSTQEVTLVCKLQDYSPELSFNSISDGKISEMKDFGSHSKLIPAPATCSLQRLTKLVLLSMLTSCVSWITDVLRITANIPIMVPVRSIRKEEPLHY